MLIRDVAIANLPTDKDAIYNLFPFIPFKLNNYTYEDLAEGFVERRCDQWFTYSIQNKSDEIFIGSRDGVAKNSGMLSKIKNNFFNKCPYNFSRI